MRPEMPQFQPRDPNYAERVRASTPAGACACVTRATRHAAARHLQDCPDTGALSILNERISAA